ncbi:unnamed protein product [Ceutorhynchus assimilis]|uniref:F-box domain-containing protein n=1 Tax=Ceutorhynchus assimilis TaxID=467358 RepID=A0A9N9MUT9_9CUCU|nr:unnamed protein product [Ceutorhynchus assimilis]
MEAECSNADDGQLSTEDLPEEVLELISSEQVFRMEAECSNSSGQLSIGDLPEEVLEFILSLLPPYGDLNNCMRVCRKWRRCVLNVAKTKQRNFQKAINDFDIRWNLVTPQDMSPPTITKRYSHTAVICDDSMYVFGGCTSAMTTFNDLWKLNLSTRTWGRPLAMGTYPSPKACSSLVHYKDYLVLFGGWTYPPTYPLYQGWHLFNELHIYDIKANRWTCVSTIRTPPPVAGHSVSVVGEWMIIFGGLQKPSTAVHCEKSNDIWKLHLETWTWYKQEVEDGPKPHGRFGQTQVILDDTNLLILGGSGGPNSQFCDCWILNMVGNLWRWIKVDIVGKSNEPVNVWSNPGCKVGDKVVVLNRIRQNDENPIVYYPRSQWNLTSEDSRLSRIDLANRRPDVDENVNGRRGNLRNSKREAEEHDESVPGPSFVANNIPEIRVSQFVPQSVPMAAFQSSQIGMHQRNLLRERRIQTLQSIKLKLKKNSLQTSKNEKPRRLGIYVLDLSEVLSKNPRATWLPPNNLNNGTGETILYTLMKGRSELIMFGGILKDANFSSTSNLNHQISNSLHFITAPNYVI